MLGHRLCCGRSWRAARTRWRSLCVRPVRGRRELHAGPRFAPRPHPAGLSPGSLQPPTPHPHTPTRSAERLRNGVCRLVPNARNKKFSHSYASSAIQQ
jgi:hypothetical protein